ncbi:MAG: serine hydrolase [Bacteroidales bacterium]|nr:serine hydrolase [Bacteroidales bacterium]MCF8351622.1 serine hydrolase [Bacteroidales bacterium]MCF8377539.1 serine hydrolase [Bacteroidales bacterium]MCF8401795.1 serine hydrolase [Bacteroidales bacterium]
MKNKRPNIPFLLLIGFVLVSIITMAQDQNLEEKISKLDTFYERAVQEWDVPGMAVAIVKDDSVLLAKGYGLKDINTGEKVNASTLFPIASITKSFTAAGLGILVDEGEISWDDKVREYLPWFEVINPYVSSNVTIRDLLSHRSGLKTFSGDLLWYGTDYSREEVVRRAKHLEPAYGFREHYGYSNIMFITAGEIIEVVSGMSWDEFMEEHFFDPLDMDRTVTSTDDLQDMPNVTTPHTTFEGETIAIDFLNWDNIGGAGAIISSVDEMTAWLELNLNKGVYEDDTIFSEEVIQELWKPHTIQDVSPFSLAFFPSTHFKAYGLGWAMFDYHGKKVLNHSGGYDGIISQMALVPEEKLGMIFLTNKNAYLILPAMYQTLDAFLTDDSTDWSQALQPIKQYMDRQEEAREKELEENRVEGTTPSLEPEDYTGTYKDEMYGKAKVFIEEGELMVQFLPAQKFKGELKHYHYDVYTVEFKEFPSLPKGLATFTLNSKGKVDKLVIDVPNPDFDFTEMEFEKQD